MFHLVSLSLQISLTDLPGSCLGLCVGVACFVVFVGLVVGFFLWGNLISITGSFQLLTDHVSHLSGNAGKKKGATVPAYISECHYLDTLGCESPCTLPEHT